MPEGCEEGILKGAYKIREGKKGGKARVTLLGSGTILNEVLKGQTILEENYDVSADVWSVTGYKELYRDALDCDRWNLLHPEDEERVPYITSCFGEDAGPFVAASDYVKALPDSIARWVPGPLHSLGTDGFGRSESRAALRDFFEVDARYVALAALRSLAKEGTIDRKIPAQAIKDLDINPEKLNPHIS